MLGFQFKEVVSEIFTAPITANFAHCGGRDFMAKTDIPWKFSSKTAHQSPLTGTVDVLLQANVGVGGVAVF